MRECVRFWESLWRAPEKQHVTAYPETTFWNCSGGGAWVAAEIKHELLTTFGKKLRALREDSGLSQGDLEDLSVPNFSAKTISAKERGVGSRAPEEDFVRHYVERCRDHGKRRRTVPDSAYNLPDWDAERTRVEDALFELASARRHGVVELDEPEGESEEGLPFPASAAARHELATLPDARPSAQFRTLSTWTPAAFGVQAPVALPNSAAVGADASVYLTRTFDESLRQDLVHGHQTAPRCITLSGWSSVGKTRSAWAAVNAVLPADTMLARPVDASALLDVLAHPVPTGSVVILDDAAEHFRESELHEVTTGLRTLLDRSEPVIVLITLHPATLGQLEELTDDPVRNGRAKRARSLIGIVHEVGERLPDLTEARRLAKVDPHLRDALAASGDTGRVIPMITGGPQLVSRLPRLAADARALILGAADCRRLGHTAPLDDVLLTDAAFAYMDQHERARTGDAWVGSALTAAGRRVAGQVAALYPVNTTSVFQIEGYEVSPYVVNHRERQQAPIPVRLWKALHDNLADGSQLMRLGDAAYGRAVYGWAYRYYTRARLLEHQGAIGALDRLLAEVNWQKPAPTLTPVPSPSVAPVYASTASDIDTMLDELDAELEAVSDAGTDPLSQFSGFYIRHSLGIYAKWAVEVLPERPDVLSKLKIDGNWQKWYRNLWDDMLGQYGTRAPTSLLTQVLRAFPPEDVSARLGLAYCLENQVDADSPSNVQERRQHLEFALAARQSTAAAAEVVRQLQTIAARTQEWDELDRLTAQGGELELTQAAVLYEEANLMAEAEERYNELADRYGLQSRLIQFWWRSGECDRAEAALRQHIVAGNRLSLLSLIELVREAGREAEAGALRRSGLEPDGSTSEWEPPAHA